MLPKLCDPKNFPIPKFKQGHLGFSLHYLVIFLRYKTLADGNSVEPSDFIFHFYIDHATVISTILLVSQIAIVQYFPCINTSVIGVDIGKIIRKQFKNVIDFLLS